MMARRLGFWALLLAPLVVGTGGCAGLRDTSRPAAKAETSREKRSETVLADFAVRRDQAQYMAALSSYRAGDHDGCRQSLESILGRTPDHRDARMLSAELYLLLDQPKVALEHSEYVLKRHPDDAWMQHATGLALEALGRRDEAAAYFARALDLNPRNEIFRRSLADARDNATATDSTGPESLAHAQAAQDIAQASEAHDTPRKSIVRKSGGPAERSDSKLTIGHANGGAEIGQLTTNPEARGWLKQGSEALRRGDRQSSGRCFLEAIAADPRNPKVPAAAAAQALQCNQPDLAADIAGRAAAQFPKQAELHRLAGAAHYRRGDFQAAQVALRQALSLDKSSALSYFLLGATLDKLGQHEAAMQNTQQAAKLDSRYAARR